MRLLIVEPSASGHHMALYARLLVREAVCRGWDVSLLTTASAARHPATDLVRAEAAGGLRVHLMPELGETSPRSVLPVARDQFRYHEAVLAGFRALPRDERPDCVFMIDMDSAAKAIALRGSPFGGTPFAGVLMGLGYHRTRMGIGPTSLAHRVQRLMVWRLLGIETLRDVTIIDECLAAYHEPGVGRYGKIRLVPDVGEIPGAFAAPDARRAARAALGIPDDRFTVLAYGSLSARKGLRQLVEAAADIEPGGVTALLAGTPDASARAVLATPAASRLRARGELVMAEGFHDADAERRVFEAADAVWVGYVEFYGSSGVLYQAGSAGLPVVASRDGLVGWVTRRYEVGTTCDPNDVAGVRAAIGALRDAGTAHRMSENARRLAAAHTSAQFATALADAAAHAAGGGSPA